MYVQSRRLGSRDRAIPKNSDRGLEDPASEEEESRWNFVEPRGLRRYIDFITIVLMIERLDRSPLSFRFKPALFLDY
jgi:hypothetical protein